MDKTNAETLDKMKLEWFDKKNISFSLEGGSSGCKGRCNGGCKSGGCGSNCSRH